MSYLIVEDDPVSAKLIESYLRKLDEEAEITVAHQGSEAITLLGKGSYSLIVLDLSLPDIDGNQILEDLAPLDNVIIISASEHFAAESYDYNVVDYLLKPISYARFAKAFGKYRQSLPTRDRDEKGNEVLFLKEKGVIHRIALETIFSIEAQGNYASFKSSEKSSLWLLSLNKLEGLLPKHFLRVHRSYIVNLRLIQKIEGSSIITQAGRVPIGKSYRETLKEAIHVVN